MENVKMKMIISADWHIRATRPRCRIDEDWIQSQRKVISQVVSISKKKKADVFVVGDLYHTNSDASLECINMVQEMSGELDGYLNVLAGNHDLPYHSSENIERSAIGVLLNSKYIKPIKLFDFDCEVSASNFDEEDNLDAEIVFKHVLVFPDVKSIPPNVDAMTAQDLLKKFPNAKWIFTGDMHKNFHYEKNGRHVINPGCLLRQASDFRDYQCGVYFVDTEKEIIEFIPIIDDEGLVDDQYILKQDEREQRIEKFANKLKDTKNVSLDYFENVQKSLLQNKINPQLKDVINELIGV